MKKIFTLLILSTLFVSVFAQNGTITGKVTDAGGIGLPGVTIQIKGTINGTITNVDGSYQISVSGGVLVFRYVGFVTQEIPVTNQSVINVVLLEDVRLLNEIVVIGYGSQKKMDLTTAVSTVSEKEIKDRPIVSAVQALQGKAAGVQVTQTSGKPGESLTVRVRGATSVLAGNEPLYVVDGVPTTDIKGLSPTDISSMSVLKDASSAAIYGARAANGVVLITTKRGKENAPVISYNTYFGTSKLRKPIEVLNTDEYRKLMKEITGATLDTTYTDYTNWSDLVFGTGYYQSYQLSVSGGNDKSRYFVSGGYLSDQGIVKPARFDRYSVRVNLDNEIKPWLKIGTSISVLNLKTKDTPDNASSGRGGVIMSTLNTPPFLHVFKNDSSGWYDPNPFQPSWENPIAYMNGPDQKEIDNQLFGSINAEAGIIKGLLFKSRFGIDVNSHQMDYYLDRVTTNYGRKQNGIGYSDKYDSNSWMWDNTLDYTRTFGKHNFTGLAGSSVQKFTGNDSYLSGNDFPADTLVRTLWAANIISGGTSRQEWALASFFARATYDFNRKYYLTATVRRDASSKLANKWGSFPSFSAGWRLSSEKFMRNLTFIDDLKIRGGWGKNGNQEGISNYASYGLISYTRRTPKNPLAGPGATQITYSNPDLKWETTTQTNIGFDVSMFKTRIVLNFDAYIKKTTDVLLNVQLSNTLPITSIQTNAGDIENRGIEFGINTVNVDKKWKWLTDFNMSFNRNKVTALKYTNVYYYGGIYSNNQDVSIVKAGLPLGSFFGYVSEGVDPATGDIKYKDLNNNGIFDPGDRTVIGNAQPDFIFGFTNRLSYKRFDLSVFFQGSYGNDIYNATRIDLEGMFDSKNQLVDVLRRWTSENTITDIPRAVRNGSVNNVNNSSRFVEDGSYVRLKSLTLSYKVLENNARFKAVKNLSVYITGQNLLTFTNYTGFDPEVNAFGSSSTTLGVDYGTYPQARSIIVGLNVEF
ncbi:MAG: TonB-dependent receptor [Porphyromonadaceae bacterium]|nr:MAG: TonB-dependent receptor [Porphyromonadaceae bacterium]